MTQFKNTLESLGLAKNEARIYEALLREGELGVSDISLKSGVHRRNAYDSLNQTSASLSPR
jgi:sugar-specific transcriptional regulator TrmB